VLSLAEKQNFEKHVITIAKDKIMAAYLEEIILCRLRKKQLSGYDLLLILHKGFNCYVSPGTIYSTLYSLERQKLIECTQSEKKRLYRLTDQGKATLQIIVHSQKLKHFLLLINQEFFYEQM
jgi:DNA-binding PadR family transcriptional regulator